MHHECLVEHHEQERAYWWFVNKRRAVTALLETLLPQGARIIEAGCGGGFFAAELERRGYRVTGADLNPGAARFARDRGLRHALAFDAGRTWPIASGAFDGFLMLDVVEHVEDDGRCLAEACRALRPGGAGVVLVPAHPALFSAWDACVGHHRRYTRRAFAARLRAAGFHIERLSYWNAAALPPAAFLRLRDRWRGTVLERGEFPRVSPALNAALIAYGKCETAWLRRLPIPAGLSLVAALRKPAS